MSAYLDLVRILAAIVVVLAHLAERFFLGIPLPFPGKDAVIVFFVLSGFVVAYAADTKERNWLDFAISRYSRLVSVLFPAMLIGLLLAPVEGQVGWRGWNAFVQAAGASAVNAFFLGETWDLDLTPPNNNAAWSLNYEACYYALFGLCLFVRGSWRWPATILVAAVVGPKILILMPPWLAGCALYYWRDRFALTPRAANLWFLGSVTAYAVYFLTDMNVIIRTALQHLLPGMMGHLQWSSRFAGDYLLCLIVVANFAAAAHMDNWLSRIVLNSKEKIRRAAGYTLSIYLYHMPLMVVFGAMIGAQARGRLGGVMVAALVAPAIIALAHATELRRATLKSALLRVAPHWGGHPRRRPLPVGQLQVVVAGQRKDGMDAAA